MRKVYRCRVTGLVGDNGDELPEQCVVAVNRATAKVMAAVEAGGYWTEETDCEILEVIILQDEEEEVTHDDHHPQ